MRRESLEDLPDLEVPAGFELRTFRAGDEGRWAKLMTGAVGDWDEESTARLFLSEPGVNLKASFSWRPTITTSLPRRTSSWRWPRSGTFTWSPWLRVPGEAD